VALIISCWLPLRGSAKLTKHHPHSCAVALQAHAGIKPQELNAEAAAAAAAASRQAAYDAAQIDASPIQARLAQELFDKGFSHFR
jgi:hypothetical protein